MAKIELSNDQLRLIQKALDFYSRIGIGQFNEILDHPTFQESLRDQFTPKKELEVGDITVRGEVVKITKKAIWTKGMWGGGEEVKKWTDIENLKLSPDYSELFKRKDEIENYLLIPRDLLYGESGLSKHGSWGIYNPRVDESCREAFGLIQKIRHQFWLADPNRSEITVDSHVDSWACPNVKVEIDK
jgi:hypothetical protein